MLSVLCAFAVVSGYLGTLITQTLTYAADQFGAGTGEQGTLLAIVRIGVLFSLGIVALADKHGRKRVLVGALIGACLITAVGAVSTGMVWLGVSQTFARSLSTVVVILIAVMAAEEMPAGTRAFAVSVVTMAAALGAGLCVLNLVYVDAALGAWRVAYLVPLIAIYPCLLMARRLPETRRFESRQRRVAAASGPDSRIGFIGDDSHCWQQAHFFGRSSSPLRPSSSTSSFEQNADSRAFSSPSSFLPRTHQVESASLLAESWPTVTDDASLARSALPEACCLPWCHISHEVGRCGWHRLLLQLSAQSQYRRLRSMDPNCFRQANAELRTAASR